jgi:hypothetical protein
LIVMRMTVSGIRNWSKRTDRPVLSREETWLRSKLSPQALEAAKWYAQWHEHRRRWLGFEQQTLPGQDLTVSERLGRKQFTALVLTPPRYERRAGLSSDGVERNDLEPTYLGVDKGHELTEQFADHPRDEVDLQPDEIRPQSDRLLQHRRWIIEIVHYTNGTVRRRRIPVIGSELEYRRLNQEERKRLYEEALAKGLVPRRAPEAPRANYNEPRRPFTSAYAPPPTEMDERCRGCTGSCKLLSEGSDPCAWRERIKDDDEALGRILQRRVHTIDSRPLGTPVRDNCQWDRGLNDGWLGMSKAKRAADDKRHNRTRRTGDIRRKRWILDHFALEGQFPAPFDLMALEEILMRLHRFFTNEAQSFSDWADAPSARALNGLERRELLVHQFVAPPRPHEIILHVAKTEGITPAGLKYLGRVASASAEAVEGTKLVVGMDSELRDELARRLMGPPVAPGLDEALMRARTRYADFDAYRGEMFRLITAKLVQLTGDWDKDVAAAYATAKYGTQYEKMKGVA